VPLRFAFLVHSTTRCTLHDVYSSATHITGAFAVLLVNVRVGAKPFSTERDQRLSEQGFLVYNPLHCARGLASTSVLLYLSAERPPTLSRFLQFTVRCYHRPAEYHTLVLTIEILSKPSASSVLDMLLSLCSNG
jgi:hypothetical protein